MSADVPSLVADGHAEANTEAASDANSVGEAGRIGVTQDRSISRPPRGAGVDADTVDMIIVSSGPLVTHASPIVQAGGEKQSQGLETTADHPNPKLRDLHYSDTSPQDISDEVTIEAHTSGDDLSTETIYAALRIIQ
ncbi:hypothetical protein CH63R_14538 [Colletotrichum higginsianum IMI 349063]|uniref:Uncharacterized protein n=1 Tax=Colletotrichum higginsianum (strain IMI 349063) TaxID=759273 RepID=A0A1B7XQC1_COLHI|nr:hypothetical protein CH63R_14538 [Colletotrichum higginsianum IMI 349063]OBR01966.1 hypothetical protein CH63R_14538 [Colletotrichum higginsianum IMI 349063]